MKKAYRKALQMIPENDKIKLEDGKSGKGRDIKPILPGCLVLKKP